MSALLLPEHKEEDVEGSEFTPDGSHCAAHQALPTKGLLTIVCAHIARCGVGWSGW